MSEEQVDYITEAKAMLGAGYEHPSVEIEAPRRVMERRNGKLEEVERPAFVKMFTNFKAELKDIDEVALKVWLYIALSVNRKTGTAWPGLRKIAKDTGFAVNTVRDAVERLENKYGLLSVERNGTKSTIYEPLGGFVSANKAVSADDTVSETVSEKDETVSVESKTVSARREKNAQPENQKNQKQGDLVDALLMFSPGIKHAELKKMIHTLFEQKLIRPYGKDGIELVSLAADQLRDKKRDPEKFFQWWKKANPNPQFWTLSKMIQQYDLAFSDLEPEKELAPAIPNFTNYEDPNEGRYVANPNPRSRILG